MSRRCICPACSSAICLSSPMCARPARAMVMVFLFLGLALGYARLACSATAKLRADRWSRRLMLLDFMPAHLASTPADLPAGAGQPSPAIPNKSGVLDLPRGYDEGNAAMMLSACHGHPIVAGETARQMGVTLLDRLQTHDLAAQQRQLAAAHVKYVDTAPAPKAWPVLLDRRTAWRHLQIITRTSCTLGIFSAWAKVRSKRYFYGNTYHRRPQFRLSRLSRCASCWAALIALALLLAIPPPIHFLPQGDLRLGVWSSLFAAPWLVECQPALQCPQHQLSQYPLQFRRHLLAAPSCAYILWPAPGRDHACSPRYPLARRARDLLQHQQSQLRRQDISRPRSPAGTLYKHLSAWRC